MLGTRGSSEVVVGVTDDGCRLDHPDFDSPGKFAGWGYFEGEHLYRMGAAGADGARMHERGSNHGTACCGVEAAEDVPDLGLEVLPHAGWRDVVAALQPPPGQVVGVVRGHSGARAFFCRS